MSGSSVSDRSVADSDDVESGDRPLESLQREVADQLDLYFVLVIFFYTRKLKASPTIGV